MRFGSRNTGFSLFFSCVTDFSLSGVLVTEPRLLEAVKKSKSAGESACATSASLALAMVGQAFSLPRPLAGAFFLSFLRSGRPAKSNEVVFNTSYEVIANV